MATTTLRDVSWLDKALVRSGQSHGVVVSMAVALLMAACFAAGYVAGGASYLTASWFCLPVVLAGAHFRYRGALVAAFFATLLAGPLMPLNVELGITQAPSLWVGRGAIFLLIGLLSAAASQRLRLSFERELGLAKAERDLAIRKAAVIESVSHEFRSPLAVIRGVTHALEKEGAVSDTARPMVAGLESASQRLVDLVTAVGAVLETEERATLVGHDIFSTVGLLTRVIDRLGVRDARSRVKVAVDRSSGACVCDAELLSQLLRHLIENAVKFSDDLVEVDVVRPTSDTFTFTVSDRGPGIEPGSVALASEPFAFDAAVQAGRHGLGLGLFASTRIAEVLGGTLTFQPRPGGGTIVRLTIPATSPEPHLL